MNKTIFQIFNTTFVQILFLNHEFYIKRCIDIAAIFARATYPNPSVGALLVYENTIISEGYTQPFGGNHAEVECINNIPLEYKSKIPFCTLYVSLEPCCHYGKTPPCVNKIIEAGIKKVVIGIKDTSEKVNGKGVELLKNAGIIVIENILSNECKEANKFFIQTQKNKIPFTCLKWALTNNDIISYKNNERLIITSEIINRYTHHLRAQYQAILVGTNTVLVDNPKLDIRYARGQEPIKIFIDRYGKIPKAFYENKNNYFVYTTEKNKNLNQFFITIIEDDNFLKNILKDLYSKNIISLFVEGGPSLLNSFLNEKLFDEIITIKNKKLNIENGVHAPQFDKKAFLITETEIDNHVINTFKNF